jgi:VWFA-related protein
MLDEGKGLVHLDVSVTDKHGDPVSGLSREDFKLVDEGRPQTIQSFHAFSAQSARPDPPPQLILFIDTLCERFVHTFCMSSAQAARMLSGIEAFLRQNGGHLAQPVSIFGFSTDGLWTVAHHDSTDGNSLAADLASGRRAYFTHRVDPLALSALGFVATAQSRKLGRKVLLWIGPGCGMGTGTFPDSNKLGRQTFGQIYWFATLFRQARLSIDVLSVDQAHPCTNQYESYLGGVRSVHDADERFLYKKVFAIQTGGTVDEGNDLVAEMNRCVRTARNFYTLSFDPPVAVQPHEFHSLQVQVDRPGLLARTTTGYYDEPYYSDPPNPALQHVTVAQLDQVLSEAHGRGNEQLANKLSLLELTQRLGSAELSRLTAKFKNRDVQQALTALADASAFLPPPPAEIPNQAAPDEPAQQHMLILVKSYLEKTIPKLPDFYATRATVRYQATPQLVDFNTRMEYQPLHVVETSKARVLYRHSNEVVESQGSEPDESSDNYLITRGTFGPLLAEVRQALEAPKRIKWVRWESGPEGTRAVLRFALPAAQSTYFEGGCCLPDAEGENPFRIQAGYRGEIAIDPLTGTILHLQLQFDLYDYVPENLDEILVDYGPVKIGGKTYVCPVMSVGIGRGRSVIPLKEGNLSFLTWGPYSTKLNDMRFSNYHMFRSESRILPGFVPAQ